MKDSVGVSVVRSTGPIVGGVISNRSGLPSRRSSVGGGSNNGQQQQRIFMRNEEPKVDQAERPGLRRKPPQRSETEFEEMVGSSRTHLVMNKLNNYCLGDWVYNDIYNILFLYKRMALSQLKRLSLIPTLMLELIKVDYSKEFRYTFMVKQVS
jgi:hypothetical protein